MASLGNSLSDSSRKLKATFLSIFKKYGRDFDNEADEIDLSTLTIVKNNGHLRNATNSNMFLSSDVENEDVKVVPRIKSKVHSSKSDKGAKMTVSIPKINLHDLDDAEEWDDCILFLLHSCFIKSIDWDFLSQDDGFECKLHDDIDEDCFDCILYSIL